MNDLISRQAALGYIDRVLTIGTGKKKSLDFVRKYIEALPSAQPQLPEWAQKVEEYRNNASSMIHNPLAWALYQVWKEYDG